VLLSLSFLFLESNIQGFLSIPLFYFFSISYFLPISDFHESQESNSFLIPLTPTLDYQTLVPLWIVFKQQRPKNRTFGLLTKVVKRFDLLKNMSFDLLKFDLTTISQSKLTSTSFQQMSNSDYQKTTKNHYVATS
jgi:hypothetical protein